MLHELALGLYDKFTVETDIDIHLHRLDAFTCKNN